MAEPRTSQGLPGHVAHGCSAGPARGIDRPLGWRLPPAPLLELDVCDITLWQWVTLWIRRFPGLASNATSGTVTDIIGNTLYVTDSSGNLVAVTVTSNTTVNRNAKSSLSSLEPGDSVTVQGTKAKNGTVSASSVSATQAGVSSGGFAGLGALGAGAPGGSTGG